MTPGLLFDYVFVSIFAVGTSILAILFVGAIMGIDWDEVLNIIFKGRK